MIVDNKPWSQMKGDDQASIICIGIMILVSIVFARMLLRDKYRRRLSHSQYNWGWAVFVTLMALAWPLYCIGWFFKYAGESAWEQLKEARNTKHDWRRPPKWL